MNPQLVFFSSPYRKDQNSSSVEIPVHFLGRKSWLKQCKQINDGICNQKNTFSQFYSQIPFVDFDNQNTKRKCQAIWMVP